MNEKTSNIDELISKNGSEMLSALKLVLQGIKEKHIPNVLMIDPEREKGKQFVKLGDHIESVVESASAIPNFRI